MRSWQSALSKKIWAIRPENETFVRRRHSGFGNVSSLRGLQRWDLRPLQKIALALVKCVPTIAMCRVSEVWHKTEASSLHFGVPNDITRPDDILTLQILLQRLSMTFGDFDAEAHRHVLQHYSCPLLRASRPYCSPHLPHIRS